MSAWSRVKVWGSEILYPADLNTEFNQGMNAYNAHRNSFDHADASITTPKLDAILTSGWMTADETWTYASATTFTITGDVTGKYQIGDKIKLTQTTIKYFNILAVSYSDPNTTIIITGGIDYTLADATITSPFYSKIENPQGFPYWFNWTPTYSGGANMTYTSVTTNIAKYTIIGKICYFMLYCSGTTGGTASTTLQFTLPLSCADSTVDYINGGCRVKDTIAISGYWRNFSATVIDAFKYDTTAYGLGTVRSIFIQGFYRID